MREAIRRDRSPSRGRRDPRARAKPRDSGGAFDPSPVPRGARARAAREHAERACRDHHSGDAANDRIRARHVLSIPRGRQRLRRRRSEGYGARAVSRLALSRVRHPRAGTQAVSRELVASHLRHRPEASADRSGPATRHRSATRPQLLGPSKRLADSHRVHEEHGRSRVDEHLAHRTESAVGAHQLFESHWSAARLAPDAIGMRVHGPPGVASDRLVRGPRAGRVARVTPSDGGRVALRDEGGHGQRTSRPSSLSQGH